MSPQSFVYSQLDGVDAALDVYVPATASSTNKAPVLIWFHGGGLLQGTRKAIWPHLTSAPEKYGLCVISADYRLAPQVRLPDIMKDMSNLMEYVRSEKFRDNTNGVVDQDRIIISGGSAGGWLALLVGLGIGFEACGLSAPAKPLGIAAIYPISDLHHPFWTTKQHPVSYFKRIIEPEELGSFLDPSSEVTSYSASESPRAKFYHYMVCASYESYADTSKGSRSLLLDGTGIAPEAFSIAPAIEKGVDLVPVYVIHGTIDDKVPIQQSIDVVNALKARHAQITFVSREGSDHLFDMDPQETMDEMYAFIKDVLSSS